MKHVLELEIQAQPTTTTCGPTCLAAVLEYFGASVSLGELIEAVGQLGSGGTLAVDLASQALRRQFDAVIVTYNLQLFDPTWFDANGRMISSDMLAQELNAQWQQKQHRSDLDQALFASATQAC